jgi:hypothetical protein
MMTVLLDIVRLKHLLTDYSITVTTDDSSTIILHNPLSLNDRIRLGNWFMLKLATQLGQVDVAMTRQELIEKLQSYDEVDPSGSMEVTLDRNIEIVDVQLVEYGKEKWLEIS